MEKMTAKLLATFGAISPSITLIEAFFDLAFISMDAPGKPPDIRDFKSQHH
jgi:hypothetical protein